MLRHQFSCARRAGLGVLVAVAAGVAVQGASADIIGDGITIIAINEDTGAQDSMTFNVTQGADGSWRWESSEARNFTNGAVLNPVVSGQPTASAVAFYEDPIVNLNFSVAAGSSTTTFMIGSALLTFPTINGATARASVGVSISDTLGDTGLLTGTGGTSGNATYTAAYNGLAGPIVSGTSYAEMIPSVFAPAVQTGTASDAMPPIGYAGIGTPVSSISSFIRFTLTPFDVASGTSTFEVVPEPASLGLLLLGSLIAIRRR
ncbi:MAG: PEP-CTERM sorting domain-containing protein [Planctomycetes bacterium]|nr:PEP-CTERM sorting domain-containing protein [Planctomycetota bacterium]